MKKGVDVIKKYLENAPELPGVYRMIGADDEVLYVGKAKNLKNRISNYTNLKNLTHRISTMILSTEQMELVTTNTESEALLLEANLIKNFRPRYNILLKDDKSFPYIELSVSHKFPRLSSHRGKKKKNNLYFGPYSSVGDVNRSIIILQKGFLLRTCSDNNFKSRERPCLEYQIKRCSAPCVGKITEAEYNDSVKEVSGFLEGKNTSIQEKIRKQMDEASNNFEYEKAAIFRDRIKSLAELQKFENVNTKNISEADIIAVAEMGDKFCVQVFFVRNNQILGNKSFFPSQTKDCNKEDVLEAFINIFYNKHPVPNKVICSDFINGMEIVREALTHLRGGDVDILFPQKGEKANIVKFAYSNAKAALERKIEENLNEKALLKKVADLFDIDQEIKRIDVFDNSHIFGKHAVGAMIVSGEDGFIKNQYRKFNVDSGSSNRGGDDYFMMRQVLERRYRNIFDEQNKFHDNDSKPDLILIDGGKGHLKVAKEVFDRLGNNNTKFVCIAKGVDRNAGREVFHMSGTPPFQLPEKDPVLFYLQRLRDEAHNFAISSHRTKRNKSISKSVLDEIEGVGATRKKALFNRFGSIKNIEAASIEELCSVKEISKKLAKVIYIHFH